jgi:Fe-S cluster biosynthesis and repair protein YggX
MATVKCVKCGLERDAMAAPPFRAGTKLADLGKALHEKICAACYKDWIAMSVKLVNETRMDTTDPRGQAMWLSQMKQFLNLETGSDPWARFLNQRVKIETTEGVTTTATLIGATPDALNLAEFEGGNIPNGFAPSATGARGSATISRDHVRTVDAAS